MLNDFFASIYELGGLIWFPEFTTQMFNLGQYGPAGVTLILSVVVILSIYYLPYGSPKYNKWFHWLIISLIAAVLSSGITQNRINSEFAREGLLSFVDNEYLILFFLWNTFLALTLAFFYSMAIKRFSRNGSRSPF
jgi:hypothetical protein